MADARLVAEFLFRLYFLETRHKNRCIPFVMILSEKLMVPVWQKFKIFLSNRGIDRGTIKK